MPLVEQDICGQGPFKRIERKKPKTRYEMYKVTSISKDTIILPPPTINKN